MGMKLLEINSVDFDMIYQLQSYCRNNASTMRHHINNFYTSGRTTIQFSGKYCTVSHFTEIDILMTMARMTKMC
jgi:hypothetical protein